MLMRKLYVVLTALLFLLTDVAAQYKVTPPIPELASNVEYMALLQEKATTKMAADSVAALLIEVRRQLRDDPGNQYRYTQQIMRSENRHIELNSKINQLDSRLSEIEQEWVLTNHNSGALQRAQNRPSMTALPESMQRRNLVENLPFEEFLARQNYNELQRAHAREDEALGYVRRYTANYFALEQLAKSYETIESEGDAIDLYDRIKELDRQNRLTADSLSACWHVVYSDKSYAYTYLLEALQQERLIDEHIRLEASTMREIRALEGRTSSDALADYILRKRALVAYESAVAQVLGLRLAADSLKGVESEIAAVCDQICALPAITVKERNFIQYDTLRLASPARPQYSDKNPIPECPIYQRGTIFRVLLATYSVNKPTYSTFRGAAPVYKLRTDDGKTRYFAGGFATEEEALEAQARLKKHGFRAPEVVVWIDGVYRNLADEPLPTATLSGFRLEISGVESLTEQMRAALSVVSTTIEVSRAGSRYIVGTFADRTAAEQAVTALHGVDPTIEIKVVELNIPASARKQTTEQ